MNETKEDRQQRQMLVADLIQFSDARGISKNKWGDCWMMTPAHTTIETQDDNIIDFGYGEWDALFENGTKFTACKKLNIAILEMITLLRGTFAFLRNWKSPHQRDHKKPIHIHILTDNHVSYHRLLKNKGTHPVVPFLLRLQCDLQQEYCTIFTYGTIESVLNRFTDSGSRGFKNTYGPQALQKIAHLHPNHLLPPWWTNMQEILRSTPAAQSHRVRKPNTCQN